VAAPTIRAQKDDNLFMIDAGQDADGNDLVRVYNILLDTLSDPILLGSLLAHAPGWGDVTAPTAITDAVVQKVVAKRY
jgi:hypothetical protein